MNYFTNMPHTKIILLNHQMIDLRNEINHGMYVIYVTHNYLIPSLLKEYDKIITLRILYSSYDCAKL